MGLIIFQNKLIATQSGESVLSALLRENINAPFNCQQGICHSCLMLAEQGDIPSSAQTNLTQEQKDQGYFLACQCRSFKRIKLTKFD
jgi:CDP-4-dehydro-6-deoxyglucose reductase